MKPLIDFLEAAVGAEPKVTAAITIAGPGELHLLVFVHASAEEAQGIVARVLADPGLPAGGVNLGVDVFPSTALRILKTPGTSRARLYLPAGAAIPVH